MNQEEQPFYSSKVFRVVSASLGFGLIALGIYTLFFIERSAAIRLAAGFVLVLVGVNAVYSAYASKQSWLAKLGPLP